MNHTPTIAVVDDDDGVRIALCSLLRSLGYEVRAYGSGPEFLNDPQDGDPDCMITDVQMSPMTGDQLQAELIATGRRFPLIFMTAFPTEAARQRLLALGACAYLDKPVDGEAMARCVADALHGAQTP